MLDVKDFADERVSVGMDAAGREAKNYVTLTYRGFPEYFILIDNADGKSGQIVILRLHGAGVLRGFTADQGAAGLNAAFRNAGDEGGDFLRLISADGNIIKEEQGLCSAADDIVDAHGDTVNADRVVDAHELCNPLLRSDPVCTGDKDRIFHAGQLRPEQSAESADIRDHAGDKGALNMLLHQTDTFVSGFNIDACGGIGCGV